MSSGLKATFFSNFLISGIYYFFTFTFSFLNNILLTNLLGVAGRGVYTTFSKLITILVMLLGEGLRKTNILLIGAKGDNLKSIMMFSGLYMTLISLVLFFAFLLRDFWILLFPGANSYLLLIVIFIIFQQILWKALQSILLGINEIAKFNRLMLIQALFFLVINFIGLNYLGFEVFEVFVSLFISSTLTSIFGFYYLPKMAGNVNINVIKNFFKDSFKLTLKSTSAGASLFVIFSADIFLIQYYLGAESTGLYSIPVIFSELIQRVPDIIGPLVINKSLYDKEDKANKGTVQIFRILIVLNLMFAITLFLFGKSIIMLLFNEQYIESYYALILVLPGLIVYSPGTMLYSYFVGKGYTPKVIVINTSCGLFNLILNVIFLKKYGIEFAALLSSITYILWTFAYMVYYKSYTKIKIIEMLFIKKEDFHYLLNSIRKYKLNRNG